MLPGKQGEGSESPVVKNKISKSTDLVDPMQVVFSNFVIRGKSYIFTKGN